MEIEYLICDGMIVDPQRVRPLEEKYVDRMRRLITNAYDKNWYENNYCEMKKFLDEVVLLENTQMIKMELKSMILDVVDDKQMYLCVKIIEKLGYNDLFYLVKGEKIQKYLRQKYELDVKKDE